MCVYLHSSLTHVVYLSLRVWTDEALKLVGQIPGRGFSVRLATFVFWLRLLLPTTTQKWPWNDFHDSPGFSEIET